jgi:hypothetical protein
MRRLEFVAVRSLVQIDLGIGRRTIFREHLDELAERVRSTCAIERSKSSLALMGMFDALTEPEPAEPNLKLDADQELILLQAIDDWMRDADKLPDDVLALRHALRRRGI